MMKVLSCGSWEFFLQKTGNGVFWVENPCSSQCSIKLSSTGILSRDTMLLFFILNDRTTATLVNLTLILRKLSPPFTPPGMYSLPSLILIHSKIGHQIPNDAKIGQKQI
jgi:hypothetical protein